MRANDERSADPSCRAMVIEGEDEIALARIIHELYEAGYVVEDCVVKRTGNRLYLSPCGAARGFVVLRRRDRE